MHAFLADGFFDHWLANLEEARRVLPADTTLFIGHGQPVAGLDILQWQTDYIQRFVDVLGTTVERDDRQGDALVEAVTAAMKEFLPSDDLLFLMRLSIEPMRAQLARRRGEEATANAATR
jgi:hypothetical protein